MNFDDLMTRMSVAFDLFAILETVSRIGAATFVESCLQSHQRHELGPLVVGISSRVTDSKPISAGQIY